MSAGRASTIESLSLFSTDNINVTFIRECLKRPIDGGKPEFDVGPSEFLVELLCGSKTGGSIESGADRRPLAGVLHSSHSNIPITAIPAISAAAWRNDLPGSGSFCSSGIRSVAAM